MNTTTSTAKCSLYIQIVRNIAADALPGPDDFALTSRAVWQEDLATAPEEAAQFIKEVLEDMFR
jgi:hypothetical protein